MNTTTQITQTSITAGRLEEMDRDLRRLEELMTAHFAKPSKGKSVTVGRVEALERQVKTLTGHYKDLEYKVAELGKSVANHHRQLERPDVSLYDPGVQAELHRLAVEKHQWRIRAEKAEAHLRVMEGDNPTNDEVRTILDMAQWRIRALEAEAKLQAIAEAVDKDDYATAYEIAEEVATAKSGGTDKEGGHNG